MSSSSSNGIIGGYWPSWDEKPPTTIPTSYYTHVFYSFVTPDLAADCKLKITQQDETLMPQFTGHLHSKKSSVKAFLAIGGGHEEAGRAMSAMASNESNRERFIQSAIDVAQKYGFDGLDLDWEYPSGKTGMQYLAALFVELRGAVDQEAHRKGRAKLGISAAVFFAPDLRLMSPSRSPYPDAVIAKNVDFINLMCYDYAGDWNTTRTGSLAALYGGEYCTSYGIQKWIEAGVPREKLVMGLPLHGRTWKLSDQNNHGIGAPAVGTGPEDDINSRGYMKYHNVVTFNETSSSF